MSEAVGNEAFRFVDAHVHFYDMQHPKLHYADWQPDSVHPALGTQKRKIGERNYLAQDFIAEASPHGMVKAVHIQAAGHGSKDPVDETRWLQAVFEESGIPQAIVGHVDLNSQNARLQIEQHLESPNFKGVRDLSSREHLGSNTFKDGLAILQEYGLIASIAVQWQEMEVLTDLAGQFPRLTIVLDHTGLPQERNYEYFQAWRAGMSSMSKRENIICKISGLGMGDNSWTVESIRPYVETSINLFGCERSLFATNWPVDSLWSGYGDVVDAYRTITKSFTQQEKTALFSENTEKIYDI